MSSETDQHDGLVNPDDSGDSVDIFGRRYNVRSGHEPETLRALARYVDGRMRQVSEQVAPGDVVSIAVLTALNIADDYYQARRALEQRDQATNERAQELAHKLRAAIEPVE